MPANPRGPRKKRVVHETMMLACPCVSPEWELSALRTLMKPQTGGRIAHRAGWQPWDETHETRVRETAARVAAGVGFAPEIFFPNDGDYHCALSFTAAQIDEARGLALALSKALPETWWTIDRLFVRGGQFFRRRRGYELVLGPARDVHLTAAVRGALRDVLR